ncbi:nitrate transporter 1.2-like [Hibiscus syriacus]|uniref:Nitrate transporter 1.2-like n=1 Tax=Hibiscus syriacus TaxID=106335 RepID=A0A6A3C8E3_HIBSY|nr:nitrate transporter 1.2-like [Hibiscus syriacus]
MGPGADLGGHCQAGQKVDVLVKPSSKGPAVCPSPSTLGSSPANSPSKMVSAPGPVSKGGPGVLSNIEKAGLLSKAEELGLTLSSIEKLDVFSKAEELGLLSLLEKAANVSPSTLAKAALPALVAALLGAVII